MVAPRIFLENLYTKLNHENTKSKKHEIHERLFRGFVMKDLFSFCLIKNSRNLIFWDQVAGVYFLSGFKSRKYAVSRAAVDLLGVQ